MTNTFKVGDEVYVYDSNDINTSTELSSMSRSDIEDMILGTIKFIDDKELGLKCYYSNRIEIFNPPYLLFSKTDVESRSSILESEFKKVEQDVLKEVKSAVKLVEQANKKAQSAGVDLIEVHEAARLLKRMISDIGWSSSSLSC